MKTPTLRQRISLDVRPEEHRRIKVAAIVNGETIRDYVLESVRARLRRDPETRDLAALTQHLDQDAILKALWANEHDVAYDAL